MRLRIFLAASAIAFLSSPQVSFGKEKESIVVSPIGQEADAANGGVIYALPQTVVRIKLTAQVVVSTAGPFFKYSTRYMNLTNVVTSNAVSWKLTGAEVMTVGVADNARRYRIVATPSASMPSVSLTPDGILEAVNADAPSSGASQAQDVNPRVEYASFDNIQLPGSVQTRTSTAAMAESCANVIFELRDSRIELLSGSKDASLPDAGSYATVLGRLDRLESDYVSLFAGVRDTLIAVRYVDVVPDYSGANSTVPIRFSETHGFVDAMDLTGKPVYVDVEYDDAAKVNAYAEGSKQRKSAPLTGLRYCIPGYLNVKVLDRNNLLTQTTVRCSQNGQIATLPAELLLGGKIVLDPSNGALVSVGK